MVKFIGILYIKHKNETPELPWLAPFLCLVKTYLIIAEVFEITLQMRENETFQMSILLFASSCKKNPQLERCHGIGLFSAV